MAYGIIFVKVEYLGYAGYANAIFIVSLSTLAKNTIKSL